MEDEEGSNQVSNNGLAGYGTYNILMKYVEVANTPISEAWDTDCNEIFLAVSWAITRDKEREKELKKMSAKYKRK